MTSAGMTADYAKSSSNGIVVIILGATARAKYTTELMVHKNA